MITIDGNNYREIIIKDNENNLLAMITDEGEIIEADGVKVECVPYQ